MEFSFRSRQKSIDRFKSEEFDFLVIGGGITGAAVARDAATRGLKVAVVEKNDFAFGTSSRSSKLIHGGLRYLENFEFKLVFEALAERSLLLESTPHMVRPLPFFMPVYNTDKHSRSILSLGLWLYDLLALFRTPGFHHRLSKKGMEENIPFIEKNGLLGGFRYYDASMWDDVLAVQTLRSAYENGAAVANYVEAKQPIWNEDKSRIMGFVVKDRETNQEIQIKAKKVICCVGPWTDTLGSQIEKSWKPWLNPSKGIHIVFDYKKIPLPGALVMSHPTDGRISFVIPRKDYGSGVVIVGTTDGPTPKDPEKAQVEKTDIQYLMTLLDKYFPSLQLKASDILSAYVGVRPLVGNLTGSEGQPLQKVSREHHIDVGPGRTVIVAGGKYTTHRKMAEEIVDFALKQWKKESRKLDDIEFPKDLKRPNTKDPINVHTTGPEVRKFRRDMIDKKVLIPIELIERYGSEALEIMDEPHGPYTDPVGFPALASQLRYSIRHEMVLHLEDFYLRRQPLYLSREDHGLPWADMLAKVWAEETGEDESSTRKELSRLNDEFSKRSIWKN
jgi:glycerol-3-phosphate dehydrogenase